MIAAFAYLTTRSIYNRLRGQVLRLKNPRYAIAIVLGLVYFYFVFFHRSMREGREANPLATPLVGAVVPILVFFYVAYLWIAGTDRTALAFSPAEVSMLFTAPVSRRGLIVYKLVRSQAGVLVTSLLWFVLFRSPGVGIERAVGSWVLLSTFSLHRLGAALVHASSFEHGTSGLRRSWIPLTVFGAAFVLVVMGIADARYDFSGARDAHQFGQALATTFGTPPLRWILWPFSAALAPLFAPNVDAWFRAMGPALLVLALHFIWVLRTDTAFEEAAVAASAAYARRLETMRTRGVSGLNLNAKSARWTLPLSSIGPPSIALIWKNILWLVRTGQVRSLLLFPVIAAVAAAAFAGRSATAELMVVIMCLSVAVMILVFGPATMRNDLRGDLRRLPILKTMPLRGREILLAEVASSATPTAVMQYLLVAVGLIAMSFTPRDPLTSGMRLGALVGAPVFLFGLSLANFTIHNGLALLFPGWVRSGETGAAGVEVMGQMMLTTILTFTLLALLLVVPAIVATVVYVVLQWPLPALIAASAMTAGAALAGEAYVVIGFLGSSLERLEPQQV